PRAAAEGPLLPRRLLGGRDRRVRDGAAAHGGGRGDRAPRALRHLGPRLPESDPGALAVAAAAQPVARALRPPRRQHPRGARTEAEGPLRRDEDAAPREGGRAADAEACEEGLEVGERPRPPPAASRAAAS